MLSPARDPNFASSKQHGEIAQLRTLWLASSCCPKHRTAIDVGAHIGIWTKELSRLFKEVWAFEPCSENFECLKANAPRKAQLVNVALGDCDGKCDLDLPEGGNSGMWRVAGGDKIELHTLDSYTFDEVDLIKIDAEGYEGKVLKGALETIRLSRPVIVFEDNGLGEKYYGFDWLDPKVLLAAEGYEQVHKANKDLIWAPKC